MKTYNLSNKSVASDGDSVGTVQPDNTDNTQYKLTTNSAPADYSDPGTSPTVVQETGAPPVVYARRRASMLIAS